VGAGPPCALRCREVITLRSVERNADDRLQRLRQLVADVADQAGQPKRWEYLYLLLALVVLVAGVIVLRWAL
jgi:hypothetical protein